MNAGNKPRADWDLKHCVQNWLVIGGADGGKGREWEGTGGGVEDLQEAVLAAGKIEQ